MITAVVCRRRQGGYRPESDSGLDPRAKSHPSLSLFEQKWRALPFWYFLLLQLSTDCFLPCRSGRRRRRRRECFRRGCIWCQVVRAIHMLQYFVPIA